MKRLFAIVLFSVIVALCFPVGAAAQEFRIKKLVCEETESIFSPDAIYIVYRINDSDAIRYPSSADMAFDEGTERANLCYLNVRNNDTIHIELWDHDRFDADDYIGSFDVRVGLKNEDTITLRQRGGTAVYKLTYTIE